MRLLDLHQCDLETGILKLFDTQGKEAPSYAILSHRWQPDEVLFADLEKHPKSKQGYAKVANAIQLARQHAHEYLWIDSYCIDKSSSAELSEAINSMWAWYSNATVCYLYLCDVSFAFNDDFGPSALEETECGAQFLASVWFTRGWTLQELLAPESLLFYNSEWVRLGDNCSLRDLVSKASGISTAILSREQTIAQTSIARRMSWASRRTTTRIEDIAYCLFGIFSVNMPLLYGEGHSAFIRLQESILRSSDDYSIFAWMSDVEVGRTQLHGILADSPAVFEYSGSIMPYQTDSAPCTMTNKGLSIALELVRGVDEDIALLPCLPASGRSGFVGIHIREIAGGYNQYARTNTTNMAVCLTKGSVKPLFFPQDVSHLGSRPVANHHLALRLDFPEGEDTPYKPIDSLVYFHAPLTRYDWKSNAPYESAWARRQSRQMVTRLNQRYTSNIAPSSNRSLISQNLQLPAWSPGAGLAVLFHQERRAERGGTQTHSALLLWLGTKQDGELGYCVRDFDMQSVCTRSDSDFRTRYLFEELYRSQTYGYSFGGSTVMHIKSGPLDAPHDLTLQPIDSAIEVDVRVTPVRSSSGPGLRCDQFKSLTVSVKKTQEFLPDAETSRRMTTVLSIAIEARNSDHEAEPAE